MTITLEARCSEDPATAEAGAGPNLLPLATFCFGDGDGVVQWVAK